MRPFAHGEPRVIVGAKSPSSRGASHLLPKEEAAMPIPTTHVCSPDSHAWRSVAKGDAGLVQGVGSAS